MWCFKSPFLLVRSHFVLVTYLFLRVKLPFLSVKSPNFCGWNPRLPMPLSWKKFFHVQVHWAGLGDRRKVIWTAGWTAGLEKLGIGPRENGIINGRKRDIFVELFMGYQWKSNGQFMRSWYFYMEDSWIYRFTLRSNVALGIPQQSELSSWENHL